MRCSSEADKTVAERQSVAGNKAATWEKREKKQMFEPSQSVTEAPIGKPNSGSQTG